MWDVSAIVDRIRGNTDNIECILEHLGFRDIKRHSDYLSFPRLDGDNPAGMVLYIETLKYICTTRSGKGDLLSLVQKVRDCPFPDAIKWIVDVLGFSESEFNGKEFGKIVLPFGGFYKNLITDSDYLKDNLPTYDLCILNKYNNGVNMRFWNDGIPFDIQRRFNVGYDYDTNRITIPEYNLSGELVGIMGRANWDCDHSERWLPIIPFPKSKTLYGYWQNYQDIQEKSTALVFESEKAVMQAAAMNLKPCIALGGCNLSQFQASAIKKLFLNRIILGLDEGIERGAIIANCEKLLSDSSMIGTKIGYIWDKDNRYLPKGSKASPTDLGENVIKGLLKECVQWIT